MDENEVKQLMEHFKKLKKNVTRENAMASFVGAGILDEKGEFTKPYSNLKNVIVDSHA